MIGKGFTYFVPPFMIRSQVVTGVMSFAEMDAMMYKIEGEDLYLIGTSEHSMIGKFIDQIIPEENLPYTLTSYSPCFRKEKGLLCDLFATVGNTIAFLIGKRYGRRFLNFMFPEEKIRQVDDIIAKGNPTLIHVLFMFLPLPKDTYAWLGYYSGDITFIILFE